MDDQGSGDCAALDGDMGGAFAAVLIPVLLAASGPGWLVSARIATPYDLGEATQSWEEGVDQALEDGVNVILDWCCSSGYWKCLYEPMLSEDMAEISSRAAYVHAHSPQAHYIVYLAPLEYVTPDVDQDMDGQPDQAAQGESLYLNHPEWLQVGVDGRSAVFFGSMPDMPFWVCPTCEDVWLTPCNAQYMALVMNQLKALASSGIDGIWLDVPFFRSSFGSGWQDQWPDVGPFGRAEFSQEVGLSLPEPPFEPDWSDPVWQSFIAWRYSKIRSMLESFRKALVSTNPSFAFIVESSVEYDPFCTQTAADPYLVSEVAHSQAHEAGGTERPVQKYRWLRFIAELMIWRQADLHIGKPSWLLSYVEAGHNDTYEQAALHAAVWAPLGFSAHLSGDETMSHIVDRQFRRDVNQWVELLPDELRDGSMKPYGSVAVVFSRGSMDMIGRGDWSRDYYSDGFYGVVMALLEAQVPVVVIRDDQLDELSGYEAVYLPSMELVSDDQLEALSSYVASGGLLVATGRTATRYPDGSQRPEPGLSEVCGVTWQSLENEELTSAEYGEGRCVFSPRAFEQEYYWSAEPWSTADRTEAQQQAVDSSRQEVLSLLEAAGWQHDQWVEGEGVVAVPFVDKSCHRAVAVVNLNGVGEHQVSPQSVEAVLRVDWNLRCLPLVTWMEVLGGPGEPQWVLENCKIEARVPVNRGGLLWVGRDVRRPSGRLR